MLGAGAGAVSWLCMWWRQVAGARCWCWVPGAGAGAGAVSWLCTWWRQVAGAGAGSWCGDRLLVLVLGAGAGGWWCSLHV